MGHPEATISELVEGFRVPGEVIDYAARLLTSIAPQLGKPHSIRNNRGELVIDQVEDVLAEVPARVRQLAEREGTVGLIVADADRDALATALADGGIVVNQVGDEVPGCRIDLVPASLAKGLEFDHVLLLEPSALVAGEADRTTGLHRLYVCLTRAVTSLVVLHHEPLPEELA